MTIGRGSSGLVVIVGIGCALYYTNAGSWVWGQVKKLDENCYTALARANPSISKPVCSAVAYSIGGLETTGGMVGDKVSELWARVWGASNFDPLNKFTRDMRAKMDSLASSRERLEGIRREGPYGTTLTNSSRLQQSIDSFTIGQRYLNSRTTAEIGIPWLEAGARQPDGLGVMSEITLGNLYAQGDQGVQANPERAERYLRKAQDSLRNLMASNTPEARQLINTLPAKPEDIMRDLEQTLIRVQASH